MSEPEVSGTLSTHPCFQVGMLTELIMTTRNGERAANGEGSLKIRKRRRHRDSINGSNASQYGYEPDTKPLYSNGTVNSYNCGTISNMSDQFDVSPPIMPQYENRYPKMETDQWHNSGQFYSSEPVPVLPEYFDYEFEYKRPVYSSPPQDTIPEADNNDERFEYAYDERKPSLMAMSDIHIDNEVPLRTYRGGGSSDGSEGGQEQNNQQVCALSDSMLSRNKINGQYLNELPSDEWAPVLMDFSSSLCAFKLFRLEELLSANEIMAVPNRGPPISYADYTLADQMVSVSSDAVPVGLV